MHAHRNIILAGVSLEQSLEASQGFESYQGHLLGLSSHSNQMFAAVALLRA
jgi:hypothetical protein